MRINEIILTEDQKILNEVSWSDVKKAIVAGLISLTALGIYDLDTKDVSQMSPDEVKQELQTKVDSKDLAKAVKAQSEEIDPRRIGQNIELYAKYWMRSVGYDTKMFGHQQGRYMLSDKVEGAPKGNGYWNFQIKVENRFGGTNFVPVIIGFANYKMNSLKIDGESYDIPDGYDIRKPPKY